MYVVAGFTCNFTWLDHKEYWQHQIGPWLVILSGGNYGTAIIRVHLRNVGALEHIDQRSLDSFLTGGLALCYRAQQQGGGKVDRASESPFYDVR